MKKKDIIFILVVGIIIGGVFAGYGAYAATSYALSSDNVEYKDNSGLGVTNVQAAIDGTCIKFSNRLTNLKQEVINEMYPKGSIYITTELATADAVAEKLGGTWESYGSGKTLVGDDGKNYITGDPSKGTGGTTAVSTKLSVDNLPSHTHSITHSHTTSSKNLSDITVSTANLYGDIGMHNTTDSTNIFNLSGAFSSAYTNESYYTNVSSLKMAGSSSIGVIHLDVSHSHTVAATVPSLSTSSQSTTTSGSTGSGTAFTTSTMQPYIVVYMYRRTA